MAKKKNEWLGFYKEYKLHKACANDDFRPAMHYICFKDGYAYATDAHIAVRASLDAICALSDEEKAKLNGYLIHKSQYEMLLKYSTIEIGEGTITLIDPESKASTTIQLVKLAASKEEELETNGKVIYFPDVDAIINKDAEHFESDRVGFNYNLLGRIVSAMGLNGSRTGLRFTGNGRQMFILGVEPGIDVRGIIMPIMMED